MRKAERGSGREIYASHEWTRNRSKTVSLVWPASAVTPTYLVRSVLTPSRHTQEAWLPRWRAVSLFPSLSLSLWLAITLPTSNRLPRTRKDPVAGAPLSCKRPVDFLISWTYRLAPRSAADRGSSTTLRLPWIHFGFIGLSHGLFLFTRRAARSHHNHPNDG